MFLRLVARALYERRRRFSIALVALVVGATLAAALLTTHADLHRKMSGELRRYGANVVVSPAATAADSTLDAAAATRAASDFPTLPFLYVVGRVNDEPALLAGMRFERLTEFARFWNWQGRAPQSSDECAAGERLAAHFRLKPGTRVKVGYASSPHMGARELRVTGIVSTGTSEDNQLLIPLATVQELSGLHGRLALLQLIVPGTRAEVESARARMAAALGPPAEVRLLRAVADSSARVLLKIRWTLFAVSAIVLGIIGLCVMTTLSAAVLERRRDVAIMKALGGTERRITRLFVAESAALALSGAALGCVPGVLLARWLGRVVFQAPVEFRAIVLPEVALVTVTVALIATLIPLRLVRLIQPAAILKGE